MNQVEGKDKKGNFGCGEGIRSGFNPTVTIALNSLGDLDGLGRGCNDSRQLAYRNRVVQNTAASTKNAATIEMTNFQFLSGGGKEMFGRLSPLRNGTQVLR